MQAQSRKGANGSLPVVSEQLENRTLLAVTIDNGVLFITGTDADDVIIVKLDADDPNLMEIDFNNDPPATQSLVVSRNNQVVALVDDQSHIAIKTAHNTPNAFLHLVS